MAKDDVDLPDSRASTERPPEGGLTVGQYVILIYDDESAVLEAGPEVVEGILRDHDRFIQAHGKQVLVSHRLRPGYAATSVRHSDRGETLITDGVFAEAKEVLGGFYLVSASDLDEALALAVDVPAPFGGVEVRPLWLDDE
jgi:hypothetical protein